MCMYCFPIDANELFFTTANHSLCSKQILVTLTRHTDKAKIITEKVTAVKNVGFNHLMQFLEQQYNLTLLYFTPY